MRGSCGGRLGFEGSAMDAPPNCVQLIADDVHLEFSVPFEWNVEAVSKYIAYWLTSSAQVPSFSVVGLLSSAKCFAKLWIRN